mmetsp:Transcript_5880/g.9523  ORF Transcript_5880/g.9523 Transcript_5880/m.9523 type:complete len:451 (-) Transcript_5880:146-1498(-)
MAAWTFLITLFVCSPWILIGVEVEEKEASLITGDVEFPACPLHDDDCTSMLQVSSMVSSRKESDSNVNSMKEDTSHSSLWNSTYSFTAAELFDSALHSEIEDWTSQNRNDTTRRCLPFETSTVNGMPLCVDALIFGLCGAGSMPLGAILGIVWAPMSKELIAQYLALGSGALVFAVATQLYGDHLFALVAISRRYGNLEGGCYGAGEQDICFGKLFDLIEMIFAGLLGAWLYVRMTKLIGALLKVDGLHQHDDGDKEDMEDFAHDEAHGSNVAIAMWAGMLLDSVPEALMLGLMTNQHRLKFGFLFAIFLSNFPEAFSCAGILREHRWSNIKIFLLWFLVFLVTGLVAMAGSFVMPESCAREAFTTRLSHITAIAQGISGGMMLAMLASAMLPESYRLYRESSGLFFVLGFVISVGIQTLETYFGSPQEMLHHRTHPYTSPFAKYHLNHA